MDFICKLCNKKFKTKYNYERHQNNKKPCIKENYDCEICKIKFNCKYDKERHVKTQKHIKNNANFMNSDINNSNIHVGDKIFNLTLNINSFNNTDLTEIRKNIIEDIGERVYLNISNKKYLTDTEKAKRMFETVLEMLEKLHFNINIEENHNLKILLIFPGIKKQVYEYLILDINKETNEISWCSLTYEEFIKRLFSHLYSMNNKFQNDYYDKFILFLERILSKEEETRKELKPYIEKKLGDMYLEFNKKQKKQPREIKTSYNEKMDEFINYRNAECRLNNGYIPTIIDQSE
jgi:hypothetical protein